MVGDNADGNVILLVIAVLLACNALHMVQNSGNGIDLKQVVNILHDNGQTLQTHTGINVGSGQQLIVALAVSIVLAEHKVPDLDYLRMILIYQLVAGDLSFFFFRT